MPKYIDITGQKFEKLTVIEYHGKKSDGTALWKCKCDCDNPEILIIPGGHLRHGFRKSCGCLQANPSRLEENGKIMPEYFIWHGIQQRCYNPNMDSFINYGARGITVCDRWLGEHGWINFITDMGRRQSKKYSIERMDNEKGYSPENCIWATRKQQQNNRRVNRMLEYNGIILNVTLMAEHLNIPYKAFEAHIRRGHSVEYAIDCIKRTAERKAKKNAA